MDGAHLPSFQSQCPGPWQVWDLPDGRCPRAPRHLAQWVMGSAHSDVTVGLKTSPRCGDLMCQSQVPKLLACPACDEVAWRKGPGGWACSDGVSGTLCSGAGGPAECTGQG